MRSIHLITVLAAVLALAACGSGGDGEAVDGGDGGGSEVQTQGAQTAETETETEAETGDTAADTGAEPMTIEIVETSFDLSSPRVEMEGEALELGLDEPGTYTFRVVNEASIPHALAIDGPGVDAETGNIPGGGSAELTVTFEEAGEYDVWCPVGNHRELGMDGTIVVGGGGEAQSGGGYGGG